eukprot:IDg16169t1
MRAGFVASARVWQGLSGARFGARSKQACTVRPVMTAAASVEELTRTAIKENNVMVFSKSRCPYCVEVKALFNELGVDHAVWELDEVRCSALALMRRWHADFLYEATGQTTVPNIFINEQHVGGCDGTFAHDLSAMRVRLRGTLRISRGSDARPVRLCRHCGAACGGQAGRLGQGMMRGFGVR